MKKIVTNFVLNIIHIIENSLRRTNEGGRTIRTTRSKKFKNKGRSLKMAAQLVAIWYLLIITGSYLTSDTGAYFNDTAVINNSFQVGTWDVPDTNKWDKSSLDIDPGDAWAEGCKVYATIKNSGDEANTLSTWRFYVYKVFDNKPSDELVATGVVPLIESGKFGEMSTTVSEPGVYAFTVRRPLGHPAGNDPDENGYTYLGWSDYITVNSNCGEQQTSSPGQPDSNTNQPSNPDHAIGEVTNISWNSKGSSGKITIGWENPTASEFSHVQVYVDGELIPKWDNIINQKLELEKKDTENTTIYRIITVDKNGKKSNGKKITVSKTGVELN